MEERSTDHAHKSKHLSRFWEAITFKNVMALVSSKYFTMKKYFMFSPHTVAFLKQPQKTSGIRERSLDGMFLFTPQVVSLSSQQPVVNRILKVSMNIFVSRILCQWIDTSAFASKIKGTRLAASQSDLICQNSSIIEQLAKKTIS